MEFQTFLAEAPPLVTSFDGILGQLDKQSYPIQQFLCLVFPNKIIALLGGSQVATSSIHNFLLLLIISYFRILILKMRYFINAMCFWTEFHINISRALPAGKVFVSTMPQSRRGIASPVLHDGPSSLPREVLRLRTCARRSSHEHGH